MLTDGESETKPDLSAMPSIVRICILGRAGRKHASAKREVTHSADGKGAHLGHVAAGSADEFSDCITQNRRLSMPGLPGV